MLRKFIIGDVSPNSGSDDFLLIYTRLPSVVALNAGKNEVSAISFANNPFVINAHWRIPFASGARAGYHHQEIITAGNASRC